MITIRRLYIYLVSAISLQAFCWAGIFLLRNTLLYSALKPDAAELSFQIALVLVGIPFYLVHWLWAQRLAGREKEESASTLRWLYLYGIMAGCLAPAVANLFDLFGSLLRLSTTQIRHATILTPFEGSIFHLTSLVILAGIWFYHYRIAKHQEQTAEPDNKGKLIKRWYTFGFGSAGLIMAVFGLIHLIRWIMLQFKAVGLSEVDTILSQASTNNLYTELVRLGLGAGLWLIFWQSAQRQFTTDPDERESALRKLFLYAAVFMGTLLVVTNATILLAGFLRAALGLPSQGDISTPLPIILVMGAVWFYYYHVLREDGIQSGESSEAAGGRKAGIERLYRYLIGAIGLGAVLVGLGGLIRVLLDTVSGVYFNNDLREQLAWFTAALAAGLPVWLLPWRKSGVNAHETAATGQEERQSLVRRVYLYFFILVATLAAISSTVFILFRIIGMMLGESTPTLTELGLAIAYAVLAVGVWLYHGSEIRRDGRLNDAETAARRAELSVLILDTEPGEVSRLAESNLRQEFQNLKIASMMVSQSMGEGLEVIEAAAQGANLIILPLSLALTLPAWFTEKISPLRKLIIPNKLSPTMDLVGIDLDENELKKQLIHAVQQVLSGAPVRPARPMGIGAILGLILLGLISFSVLMGIIGSFIDRLVSGGY